MKVVFAAFAVVVISANEQEIAGKVRYFPSPTDPTGYIQPGLPLPLPRTWTHSSTVFEVRGDGFVFNATGNTCDDLEAAFDRYYKMIFDTPNSYEANSKSSKRTHKANPAEINGLDVYVHNPCTGKPRPALGMSENYKLQISSGKAMLSSDSLWGALRGLETFSQIVYETMYESHGLWLVNETMIEDAPRFQHRGFLIDSSRHFLEKNVILQFVSALSMAKYNILHWHIVDSESFPYRSRVFPDLSRKGAYEPYTHTYSHEDIAEVIEYSRQRGIRVVVEFDTPGHTLSWGYGQPGLLTECYGKDGKPDGTYGPIDPTKNSTYAFLERLFTEVNSVFPDQYIHLGGDEVSFDCWKSNPNVNAFMAKAGIKAGDYAGLESYYMTRLTSLVSKIGNSYIVWQEPLDNGVKLAADTVVNVWKNYGVRKAAEEMTFVTKSGYKAITSACWYLNMLSYGEDWHKYYQCDPLNFNGTDTQKALVMGGEGCMWGEWVDTTNLMSRTWPRAAVVAERLWSPATATDLVSMKSRLEVHRCRMLKRGLDANPIDPSYCKYEKQVEPPMF